MVETVRPRRKSYLLAQVRTKEAEEKQLSALRQRFRRIVLVADAQNAFIKLGGAGAGAGAGAAARGEGLLAPPTAQLQRRSDSALDERDVVEPMRQRAKSLSSRPAPPGTPWALVSSAADGSSSGSDDEDARPYEATDDILLRVAADAARMRARRHSEAANIGIHAIHLAAERAAAEEQQRLLPVDDHARTADKRFIETTHGGAFIEIASLSPTRRNSRSAASADGVERQRSPLEQALQPLPAFASAVSSRSRTPPSPHPSASRAQWDAHPPPALVGGAADADAQQSFAEFTASARALDAGCTVAVCVVGKVGRDAVRAVRFAAKATTGLDVVVLEPMAKPRRTHAHPADDVLEAARGATERAERKGVLQGLALGARSTGAAIFATLALSDVELPAHLHVGAEAEAVSSVLVVPCTPTAAGARLPAAARAARYVQTALARMLGLAPCVMYACALAGPDGHAADSICPACLRKILWATPMRLDEHARAQREVAAVLGDGADGALDGRAGRAQHATSVGRLLPLPTVARQSSAPPPNTSPSATLDARRQPTPLAQRAVLERPAASARSVSGSHRRSL
ncbi:hypothetical protein KFE25_008400 [Diacronema lutheri]|uniref:Uncharacterized protein n=1 Tax=Diacronema lutheri TaxID=2081491 RepID=A0A8J6C8M2_DIALT|nr:hypothetical protein KFE25_008400 [Diacronema lutheri]